MKNSTILPLMTVMCISQAVYAQSMVQSRSFGPQIPQFSQVLTFDSYTGDVRDIDSIEISWTMSIQDGFLIIDNESPHHAGGNYEFGASLAVDGATSNVTLSDEGFQNIISDANVVNSGRFSLAANEGDVINDFSPEGPDGVLITGSNVFKSGVGTINELFISEFVTGPGGSAADTFDIGIIATQYLTVVSNGGTEYAITPVNALGDVTVRYNVIPVPEPSGMALLAVGALCLLRRRR